MSDVNVIQLASFRPQPKLIRLEPDKEPDIYTKIRAALKEAMMPDAVQVAKSTVALNLHAHVQAMRETFDDEFAKHVLRVLLEGIP